MVFPPSHLHGRLPSRGSAEVGEVAPGETSHQLSLLFCKHLSGTSNSSHAVVFPPVAFLLYLILPGLVLLAIFACFMAQYSE